MKRIFSLLVLLAFGCQWEPAKHVAPAEMPAIPVSHAVLGEVMDYVDFAGRTAAVQSVDIRPRVTGYLIRMPFQEGADVKTNDLLFEIDPRPYQAQLEQALSQVKLNQASLKLARTTYERDQSVARSTPGGVSQQQLSEDEAAVEEAAAHVKAAEASTEVYKLNLSYTKVTSPIDGQVSRYYYTLGNLVNQDQTVLTTVVSLDPMHVYFDLDEPTLLRIRKAINEGRLKRPKDGLMPVYMGLQGEDDYTHKGTINFVNNQVNPGSGSISLRGVFPNAKPSLGERLLSPGMYVRVRLPIGEPYKALLVIDRAIQSDQGLKYVYVLDEDKKIQYRKVTTAALQEDGLRVITQGLKPDDWVIVGGLQQVRPKMTVRPDYTTMPSIGRPPSTEKPSPSPSTGGEDKTSKSSPSGGGQSKVKGTPTPKAPLSK